MPLEVYKQYNLKRLRSLWKAYTIGSGECIDYLKKNIQIRKFELGKENNIFVATFYFNNFTI